jgi:hypothetical protein
MISTKPLKEKWNSMEDSTAKQLILSLPDQISKEDLVSKMDLILPFLSNKKEVVPK